MQIQTQHRGFCFCMYLFLHFCLHKDMFKNDKMGKLKSNTKQSESIFKNVFVKLKLSMFWCISFWEYSLIRLQTDSSKFFN